jgi:hypothetical protein
MTQKEAKKLAIDKLSYYMEHPETAGMIERLPWVLFDRVKGLMNYCPMCELFYVKGCPHCPLRTRKLLRCNDFSTRAMQQNMALLQAWRPKEAR